MRGHKIIVESENESQFSKDFFKSEQARAIKKLIGSDDFILISHDKNGGGDVISCVSSKNIVPMSMATHKINGQLIEMIADFMKKGVFKPPETDE